MIMRKIAGLIGLILILLIAGAAYTTCNRQNNWQNANYIESSKGFRTSSFVLNTALPEVPKKLEIYECVEPNVTLSYVSSVAKRLNMNGHPREAFDEFVLTDGKFHLEINVKSGRISYIDTSRWMVGNNVDKPSNSPSSEEAIKIATKFLRKKGFMPDDAVFRGVTHPKVVAMNGEGKVIGIGFEDVRVSFARKINGLPVVGAGSKLDVEIGGKGDVICFYKVWRTVRPYKKCPIITPEQALEKLKEVGIFTGIKDVGRAEICKVYLGYYAKPTSEKQKYLLPVYVFEGYVKGRNKVEAFRQYIPAVSDLPELGELHEVLR